MDSIIPGTALHFGSGISKRNPWGRHQRPAIRIIFYSLLAERARDGATRYLSQDRFELGSCLLCVWHHLRQEIPNRLTAVGVRTGLVRPRRHQCHQRERLRALRVRTDSAQIRNQDILARRIRVDQPESTVFFSCPSAPAVAAFPTTGQRWTITHAEPGSSSRQEHILRVLELIHSNWLPAVWGMSGPALTKLCRRPHATAPIAIGAPSKTAPAERDRSPRRRPRCRPAPAPPSAG